MTGKCVHQRDLRTHQARADDADSFHGAGPLTTEPARCALLDEGTRTFLKVCGDHHARLAFFGESCEGLLVEIVGTPRDAETLAHSHRSVATDGDCERY